AYAAGGDDRVGRGRVDEALPFYRKALTAEPDEETVLVSYANALVLGGAPAAAESIAARAITAHPTSGPARLALAQARWHAGRGLAAACTGLAAARGAVRREDRYQVDQALGSDAWISGDAAAALAAYDSVLAYQSDNPDGLHGRAGAGRAERGSVQALRRRGARADRSDRAALRLRARPAGRGTRCR